MDLVVVGHPHVGKTLLVINFAAYLGISEIRLDVEDGDGRRASKRLNLERARRDLVGPLVARSWHIQSLALEIHVGRQRNRFLIVDTPGIADGISADALERHMVAVTLERLVSATLVCHVVDASAVGARRPESPGLFDLALAKWGVGRPTYLVVANKMDRPESHEGLRWMREQYRGVPIIPVSGVTRRGFRDLKMWLARARP